jgi:hypothetical protein
MSTLEIDRGETLSLVLTARDEEDEEVNLLEDPSGPWGVDAWIRSDTAGRLNESMNPVITGDGKIFIAYDTAPIAPGLYKFDVRLTNGDGRDQFTEEYQIKVGPTVTPPSPRI